MLDNIGIRVNMAELPSSTTFAAAKQLKYGDNWKSRLWARKIRPVLFPKSQAYVDLLWDNVRRQRQRELLSAVITEGKMDEQ